MLKSNKLVLTTSSGTEIMLAVGENVEPVYMLHDIANYDVFQHLTAKAGQRNREIVGWFVSSTLLEHLAKIGARSSVYSFNNRAGMSVPEAFRGLHFCKSFLTPSCLTVN